MHAIVSFYAAKPTRIVGVELLDGLVHLYGFPYSPPPSHSHARQRVSPQASQRCSWRGSRQTGQVADIGIAASGARKDDLA